MAEAVKGAPGKLLPAWASQRAGAVARAWRGFRGLSQDEMNRSLGWPAGRYARIEQGRHRVHRWHVEQLLGVVRAEKPTLAVAFEIELMPIMAPLPEVQE